MSAVNTYSFFESLCSYILLDRATVREQNKKSDQKLPSKKTEHLPVYQQFSSLSLFKILLCRHCLRHQLLLLPHSLTRYEQSEIVSSVYKDIFYRHQMKHNRQRQRRQSREEIIRLLCLTCFHDTFFFRSLLHRIRSWFGRKQ